MKSILIVDDNEQNRYMLKIMLENRSFQVTSAENGAIALSLTQKEPPDLIISDILMPVMDGYAFLRELKKLPFPLSGTPFIFYTATYVDPKDEAFALSLGASQFLRKPLKSKDFLKVIERVIHEPHEYANTPREILDPEDDMVYKLYSEGLIQKLEKKMLDLEKEVRIRKETEKALKESEERFRQVVENIKEVFWIKSSKTGELIYVSPHAKEVFGITPDRLLTDVTVFFDQVHREDLPLVQRTFSEKESPITPKEFTFRLTPLKSKSSTRLKWIRARTFPVTDPSNRLERVAGIAEDITRKKQNEREKEALRQHIDRSRKLEAIGTLAGGIAHDFNNILSSILGFSELVIEDLDAGTIAYDNMNEIFTSAKRARELVKQILTFTRHKNPEKKPIHIGPIIKEVLKLLRPTVPATITIKTAISGEEGYVMGDATRIHQVVMNLCTNAAHAMEEKGGILTLSLMPEMIEGKDLILIENPHLEQGIYMVLTIEDTGYGISPDHLHNIFDPFFTTKDQDQGVGLGLSVVHGIVCSHNGALFVESTLNKGSIFRVYLPVFSSFDLAKESIEILAKS